MWFSKNRSLMIQRVVAALGRYWEGSRQTGRVSRRRSRKSRDWRGAQVLLLEQRLVLSFDMGDAPDTGAGTSSGNYQTTLSDGGPQHIEGGPRLGASVDYETVNYVYLEGYVNKTFGYGDNIFGGDEDGITFTSLLQASSTAATSGTLTVNVQNSAGTARLDAWIDFNADGDFADVGEKIFNNFAVVAGDNNLTFTVPQGSSSGKTFSRFRLSSAGSLTPTGLANDGEVEDYAVLIGGPSSIAVIENAILSHQFLNNNNVGDGVLRSGNDVSFYQKGNNKVWHILDPYFTSFAVRALLAGPNDGNVDKFAVAAKQLNFWLSHIQSDGSIPRLIVDETFTFATGPITSTIFNQKTQQFEDVVFDPATIGADADDSTLALILLTASDFLSNGGSPSVLTAQKANLELTAAKLVSLIGPDGLPRPFINPLNLYTTKQTLDCVEVWQALKQFSELERDLFLDQGLASFYAAKADIVANAIQQQLFDTSSQLYRQFVDAMSPNLNTWYPIVYDQVWPIITGLISPNSTAARQLLDQVYASWDGSPNPSWTSSAGSGFLAWAALQAGDSTLAATAVEHILPWALQNSLPNLFSPAEQTTTIADLGFLLQTLLPTLAGPSTMNYVENNTATSINTGIKVSDIDSTTMASATVKLTNFVSGQDVLSFSNDGSTMGNIAIQSNSSGVLMLTSAGSTATLGQWQSALRAVKYTNTSDAPSIAQRLVTFRISDGHASSNIVSSSISIEAVNDAPLRTAGALAPINVNEDSVNSTAVSLGLTGLLYAPGPETATDESIQSLTYTITTIPSFVKIYKADGITEVMAGNTVSAIELQGLKYKTVVNLNGSGNLVLTITDNGSGSAPNVNMLVENLSFTVGAVNDAPVRTGGALAAISVNEDSANSTAVTLGLTGLAYAPGPAAAADESGQLLTYTITTIPSFVKIYKADGITEVMAGNTVSATELQGLKYKTEANTNGSGNLVLTVTDSGSGSAPNANMLVESLSLTVAAVNDAPVRTGGSLTAINVNQDSANTTAVTLGFSLLAYAPGPTDAMDESSQLLTYTLSAIPTFVKIYKVDGTTEVMAGNTVTATELQGLKYKTVASASGSGNLRLTISDSGGSLPSNVNALDEFLSITVAAVNNAPVIAAFDTTVNYVENAAPLVLDGDVTLTDLNSTNFNTGTLTVALTANGQSADRLEINHQGTGVGQIEVSGRFVAFGGVPIGSFAGGAGTTPLVVTLNSSATPAAVQALLQNITFRTISDIPVTTSRTVRVTLIDDTGLTSNQPTKSINVTAVNDAPVLSGIETVNVVYTENNLGVSVSPGILVSDSDHANLTGATVTISGNFVIGQDQLLFTNANGITGSWNPASGVLTLTGLSSVSDYQTALRSVKYRNTSDSPSTLVRTIQYAVNDGTNASNAVSRNLNVNPLNDQPIFGALVSTPLAFTEGSVPLPVQPFVTISDPDFTNMSSARIRITDNYQIGSDSLTFIPVGAITGVFTPATGTLVLSGVDTVANYQTALRSVKFQNTQDNPNPASRQILMLVNDGVINSPVAFRSVNITPVNDAPVLSGIEVLPLAYTEGNPATSITSAILATDADSDMIAFARIKISGNYANGQDVLSFVNTATITAAFDVATGTLILSGTDTVTSYRTALRNVKYRNTSTTPSTATRTVQFLISDGNLISNIVSRQITVTAVP